MPPRVTFLDMQQGADIGWKSTYRTDVQHVHEMWDDDFEQNGPFAGTYPCVLAIIIHPEDTVDYGEVDLSDIHTISIRMRELPRKLRLYRNLNHINGLPNRMMNVGNFLPQWITQVEDQCEVFDVELVFWNNGQPAYVPRQSHWPHHFWLPYAEFYNELPGPPGFFSDQPVAFYFYYDPNAPRTVIRNIDRNGNHVEY